MQQAQNGALKTARIWRFGQVVLNERGAVVTVAGVEVPLELSGYQLLLALLRHAGEVVTKEELLGIGWPGRVVSDNTLTKAISRMRALLGEDARAVGAVYSYGYRLAVPVQVEMFVEATSPVTPSPPADLLHAGDDIPLRPGWKIAELLSDEVTGSIYLAHDDQGQTRVFKFANNDLGLRGLRREVALNNHLAIGENAGETTHAVVPLLGWHLDESPRFIELPYFKEGSLRTWATHENRLKNLPRADRIAMCAQLCETVAALHAADILHRDLKPDSLYPQPLETQPGWRLLLGDLGMAEAAPSAPAEWLPTDESLSSSTTGSLLYTAPEVLTGNIATPASDVYALGVLLFQMLTGDLRKPLAPGWETDIDDVLLRDDIALAAHAQPELRQLSAAELAQRLRTLDQRHANRLAARHQAEHQRRRDANWQRMRQRLRWTLALSAGLLVGLVFAVWMYTRAVHARQQAEHDRQRAEAVQTFLTEDVIRRADPYADSARDTSVHDAIVQAADKIDTRFVGQPEAAVAVYERVIDVYGSWGEYAQAKNLMQRAMVQAAKLDSPLPTARLQLKRCQLLRLTGEYDDAEAACHAAQESFDRAGMHNDETTDTLGGLMYERGDCANAVATLAPIVTQTSNDNLRADALWSTALCLPKLARFGEAEADFKQLVVLQTKLHGANDPLVGWALADYGQFLIDIGQLDRAENMLKHAEKLIAAGVGADHPDALVPGYSLAVLDNVRSQWPQAIALLTPRAKRFEEVFGQRHLWTLFTQTELAYAEAENGDAAASAKLLDQVRPLTLQVLDKSLAKQAVFRNRWARTELVLGRDTQANEDVQALQALLQTHFSPQHPWQAQPHCLRAMQSLRKNNLADAHEQAQTCRDMLLKSWPATHPEVLEAQKLLADAGATPQK